MNDNVIKVKLETVLAIILISILIVGTIVAILFYRKSNENNKQNEIKIRYAYAYNVATADSLNKMNDDGEYIDILEITLAGDDLERVNNLLHKQSFKKVNNLRLAVVDEYEVTINDEIKLSICPGEKYAYYSNGNDSFLTAISEDFVNEIDRIVQAEASKNFREVFSEKITITSENNIQVNITDEKHIKTLTENLKYTRVNINDNEMEKEKIDYIVDLNNGTKIYTYFASCLGYIIDENKDEFYVAFITNYEDIVSTIFENYASGRNESIKAEEIVVKYLGNEYKISEEEKVEYIINSLKMCQYSSHDWLSDFDEDDYGEEDIVIEIGKCRVIIPGDRTLGNRYYIDEDNNTYMLWMISDLESYFKQLVNYKN